MGSVRRTSSSQFVRFLILNVIVSAATVTLVLFIWDRPGVSRPVATPTSTLSIAAQVGSAIPTATVTVPPSPTPVTYTVQPGDTLLAIARQLGIDSEDLMAANGLTDPDTLDVGQVLVVPTASSGTASTPAPGSTPAVTATQNPDSMAARVEIRGVSGAGVLETETVLLLNSGGEASMAGWSLDDGQGHRYTFPGFVLHHSGAASVHTMAGRDTSIDLYWGMDQAIWLSGKTITLRDASGATQSIFEIP